MLRLIQLTTVLLTLALVLALSGDSAVAADKKKDSKKKKSDNEWVKLGEKEASRSLDKVDLDVSGDDTYRSVRLYAEGEKVHIERIIIRFGNDEKQEIKIDEDVEAGEKTKSLDLDGHSRGIKKVSIYCRTVSSDGKSGKVAVWALQG